MLNMITYNAVFRCNFTQIMIICINIYAIMPIYFTVILGGKQHVMNANPLLQLSH